MSQRLTPQQVADRKIANRDEIRDRDTAIFIEVVCYYHKQSDVARKFGLTQGRVSQIVKKMLRGQAGQEEKIGHPLGQASDWLNEQWANRTIKQEALSWCKWRLDDSDQPLKTTKTRRDAKGEIVFTEEIVRELPPNVPLARLIVKLGNELEASAGLPPVPPAELEAIERRAKIEKLREENELEELTQKEYSLAWQRKQREEEKERLARAEAGNPKWDEDLSTPERWGYCFARRSLSLVADGITSLADAEVCNQQSSLSNGADYPSYFEICPANISGVRVASWVRDVVPEPRLPKDEEAFLPVLHCLKEWDPSMRQLVPYDTRVTVDGELPLRFGRLVGSACRAEPEPPRDVATPSKVPSGRRDLPPAEPDWRRDVATRIEVPSGRRDLPGDDQPKLSERLRIRSMSSLQRRAARTANRLRRAADQQLATDL